MNPLCEWAQHNLVRALTYKGNEEFNKKVFPEIRKMWFVTGKYKKVFSIIKEEFEKNGRFPSWKSLVTNPSLSEDEAKYLRAKEIKRKNNEKSDVSLRLPNCEEDYSGLLERMRFDSKHVRIIKLHNRLASSLDNDNMTPEELDTIIATLKGETEKAEDSSRHKGEHVSLSPSTTRKYLRLAYKNLKNKFMIPTGFKEFDSVNMGIPSSSLFVIMGKTGGGKSTLALNICMNAKIQGARVCFVPLEMSIDEMIMKMGSRLLMEPINELNQNLKKSYSRILKVTDKFLNDTGEDGASCFDFYVPEEGDTVEDVLDFLQPYHYDIICIDYPKLLSSGNMPDWEALDKGARYAKRYATKNRCYIMWLAQMDDATESIRYSRAVMEHASNAWIISGEIDDTREEGHILIKQRKARNQVPHPFNLKCDLSCSFFGDEDSPISRRNPEGKYSEDKPRKRYEDDEYIEELEKDDDEIIRSGKKSRRDEYDEEEKRSKRRKNRDTEDETEEDEASPKKRRSSVCEEDDERPRRKHRRNREDEDEEKLSRKKRSNGHDDTEEDERPRKRRKARASEEDDMEEDENNSRRKRKKEKSSQEYEVSSSPYKGTKYSYYSDWNQDTPYKGNKRMREIEERRKKLQAKEAKEKKSSGEFKRPRRKVPKDGETIDADNIPSSKSLRDKAVFKREKDGRAYVKLAPGMAKIELKDDTSFPDVCEEY